MSIDLSYMGLGPAINTVSDANSWQSFNGLPAATSAAQELQEAQDWRNYQTSLKSIPGAINPSNYGTPDEAAAAVAQAQYNEWKNMYLPAATAALDQTTYNNQNLVTTNVNQAVGNVNQAYDTLGGTQQRYAQEYGVNPSPALSAVTSRANSINRSASVVDAANRIRQTLADRNQAIMQGGVSNFQTGGL